MTELLPPAVLKKVQRECMDMLEKPVDGIRVIINEQNIADIQAEIDGPAGTPFEGGIFRMRLQVPQDYPQEPPKGVSGTEPAARRDLTRVMSDVMPCMRMFDHRMSCGMRHISRTSLHPHPTAPTALTLRFYLVVLLLWPRDRYGGKHVAEEHQFGTFRGS